MTKRIIEPKTVSQRLKQLREEKGLTQKQLGEQSGISLNSIKNYESPSGRRTPDVYNLKILSNFFQVSEEYITGESTYRTKTDEMFNQNPDLKEWIDKKVAFWKYEMLLGFNQDDYTEEEKYHLEATIELIMMQFKKSKHTVLDTIGEVFERKDD